MTATTINTIHVDHDLHTNEAWIVNGMHEATVYPDGDRLRVEDGVTAQTIGHADTYGTAVELAAKHWNITDYVVEGHSFTSNPDDEDGLGLTATPREA